jgi:hypothetical protein
MDELPAFVIDGSFEDHEWRVAAAKKAPDRSKAEARIYQAGPRLHPYGSKAVKHSGSDGTARWFPDPDGRDQWVRTHEHPKATAAESPAVAAASEGNAKQAAAEKAGREATPALTKPTPTQTARKG